LGERSVAVNVLRSDIGGVGRTEVGTVAPEDFYPLAPRVVHGFGNQVGAVAVAGAGHADVGGGGAGVLTDHEVRGRDGLALGAVHGAGVAELDVVADVRRWQQPRLAA